jgi:hypothetical protein
MSQSLSRIWLHIVFSTKERRAYLQNENIRDEMFHMLGHHAGEAGCPPARWSIRWLITLIDNQSIMDG